MTDAAPTDAGPAAVRQASRPGAGDRLIGPVLRSVGGMIATSARDWGQYRVDTWLWGLFVGWDCEQDHGPGGEHDDICGGRDDVLGELAARHGWTDSDVALLRSHRRAVRELQGDVAGPDPARGNGQPPGVAWSTLGPGQPAS